MKKILSAITSARRWLGGVPLIERGFAVAVLGPMILILLRYEPVTPLEVIQGLWGASSLSFGALTLPALPKAAEDDA